MFIPRWVVAVVAVAMLIGLIYISRSDYRAFSARRDAWHVRCDRYVGTQNRSPDALACKSELDEMFAYAKRKGWN